MDLILTVYVLYLVNLNKIEYKHIYKFAAIVTKSRVEVHAD